LNLFGPEHNREEKISVDGVAFLLLILGCRRKSVNPGTDGYYGGFRCFTQYVLEDSFTSEIRIVHVLFTSVSNLLSTNSADGPEILILCQ
jgi:hypothetical protein